ncbi:MAG: LysM peptidoglycan-binding domain-containing protein [Dehalococcoidia bacterium]
MRVLIVFPIALLVVASTASCFFGGDDGEPTRTPTSSLPTLTPTPKLAVATSTPTSAPTVAPSPTPTVGPSTYVVEEGDSLSIIADRFGTTVEELLALNDIEDQNLIFVGQEIKLPEDATAGN